MNKIYSVDIIQKIIADSYPIIVELTDNSVYVGIMTSGYGRGHLHLRPLTINDGGISFSRSMIKRIIYFNGLIVPKEVPKEESEKHKLFDITLLDIIQLSELINKAGYEFI